MQEAAALPKGQQDMMVEGMVDSLQTKLNQNPAQPDRWIMLMRSRMTLGQAAQAGEALRRAIAANPDQEARLRAQARMLGVPGA
jgi:cytochrome c-type biogenesis protein CcmH